MTGAGSGPVERRKSARDCSVRGREGGRWERSGSRRANEGGDGGLEDPEESRRELDSSASDIPREEREREYMRHRSVGGGCWKGCLLAGERSKTERVMRPGVGDEVCLSRRGRARRRGKEDEKVVESNAQRPLSLPPLSAIPISRPRAELCRGALGETSTELGREERVRQGRREASRKQRPSPSSSTSPLSSYPWLSQVLPRQAHATILSHHQAHRRAFSTRASRETAASSGKDGTKKRRASSPLCLPSPS